MRAHCTVPGIIVCYCVMQVIHRDLKLGNLFLNDNLEVKVGDFGLATRVEVEGERKRWVEWDASHLNQPAFSPL